MDNISSQNSMVGPSSALSKGGELGNGAVAAPTKQICRHSNSDSGELAADTGSSTTSPSSPGQDTDTVTSSCSTLSSAKCEHLKIGVDALRSSSNSSGDYSSSFSTPSSLSPAEPAGLDKSTCENVPKTEVHSPAVVFCASVTKLMRKLHFLFSASNSTPGLAESEQAAALTQPRNSPTTLQNTTSATSSGSTALDSYDNIRNSFDNAPPPATSPTSPETKVSLCPEPGHQDPATEVASASTWSLVSKTKKAQDVGRGQLFSDIELRSDNFLFKAEIKINDPQFGPPIAVNCTITDLRIQRVVRVAGIHFYNEGLDAQGEFRRTRRAEIKSIESIDGAEPQPHVVFEARNALVFGTDNADTSWPSSMRRQLQYLKQLSMQNLVGLKLPSSQSRNSVQLRSERDLLVWLNGDSGKPLRLLEAYREALRNSYIPGFIHILERAYEPDGKLSRASVANVDIPSYCFSSAEEAMVKLVHGVFAEYLWEQEHAKSISSTDLQVGFLSTSNEVVIAFIKPMCRTDEKPRRALMQNMMFKIVLTEGDECGCRGKCKGRPTGLGSVLTPTERGKQLGCWYMCHMDVKNTCPRIFTMVRKWESTPVFFRAIIKVKDYAAAQIKMNAIRDFFHRGGPYKKAWPMFLGESSGDLCLTNSLRDKAGCSQQKIDQVVANVKQKALQAGMHVNDEQCAILKDLGNSYGGFSIIRGPPGCGKTTTICMIIDALLQFPGVGVYACASSNGAVNRLFSATNASAERWKWSETDPCLKPTRVCRKYHELQYVNSVLLHRKKAEAATSSTDSATDDEGSVAFVDALYKRKQELEDNRLNAHIGDGLSAGVLQAIEDGKLHEQDQVFAYKKGDGYKLRNQRESYDRAKLSLRVLQAKKKDPSMTLDMGVYNEHVENVRDQILGTRRLLISTCNNATNLLLRQAAFRDCHTVYVIADEGSLDTDASTLTLQAGLFSIDRINKEFGGKSPVAGMYIVGDEHQGSPLIVSAQEGLNPFGAQMGLSTLERLTKIGVPMHNLYEQHRMAPIIRKLPSDRCYSGMLRDAQAVKDRRLTLLQKVAIMQYFQLPNLSIKQSDVDGLHDAELLDQTYRHLLLNVRSGKEKMEPSKKSRFNTANVKVTMGLMEYLIKKKVMPADDIVILTFYNVQKEYYEAALAGLERKLNLKQHSLIENVQTSDSYQGRERKCVILDLVVTKYTGAEDSGNVWDEKRMNVACTRARELFFVVGSLGLLDDYEVRRSSLGQGKKRKAYALELLQRLKERGAYRSFTDHA